MKYLFEIYNNEIKISEMKVYTLVYKTSGD